MEIHISINIEEDFPNKEELEIQNKIEEFVNKNDLGKMVDAGAGMGIHDIFIESDRLDALERLSKFIEELGIMSKTKIEIVNQWKN